MQTSRDRWPRLLAMAFLVGVNLLWLGQQPASAHSPISTIVLDAQELGGEVKIVASIRYPDGDPVQGETVRAVAYSPDLRQTQGLALTETAGERGQWSGTLRAAAGHWQVEVDAVHKTKGLQSVGFTVGQDGGLADVSSPSPLPATVVVPGAPAEASGTGLREGPRVSATPKQLTWAVSMGVVGLLVVLVVVRRNAAAQAREPEPVEHGW